MGMITMMEKDAPCDDVIEWPLFYMNDFSVLGVLVQGLSQAHQVLEAAGYQVVRDRCSAKVVFENHGRMKNIYDTLKRNGIDFVTADLAGYAYQG